jgi:hypothetical protein
MAPPSPPILNSVPKARPTTLQFWWDPPTTGPVTGYRIQCIAAAIDVSVSETTYTYQFTGLTDATTYQFQIEAFNNDGYSDIAYFMPAQPGIVSGPPTNIAASTTDGINTTVSWTAPTTPLNVQAYWVTAIPSDAQSSNDYIIKTTPSNDTSVILTTNYISTPSQPDRSYAINVRAFTSPGWSDPQNTAATLDTVYGSYATNLIALNNPITDAQGNQWSFAAGLTAGVPINLYNRFGTLVQTIPGGLVTSTTNIIIYVSADGYSNLWMARLQGLTRSTASLVFAPTSPLSLKSLVDSQGNLIMIQTGNGSTSVSLFDKTNTIVRTITLPFSTTNVMVVIKLSPTGVWSGSTSDPNTWMAFAATSSSSTLVSPRAVNYLLDSNNNIIISGICTNTTTTNTLTILDKTGSIVGTITIPLLTGTSNYVVFFIKYRSDGASTGVTGDNSWRAYVDTKFSSFIPYLDNLKINKYNQIISAFSYKSSPTIIYGSDNLQIGEALPFTSTMGTASSFTDSCIVRFCSSGQAASSWRAVQFSSTLGLSKLETPRSIHITSTDDIIYTSFSEALSTNINYFACGSTNNSFLSTTLNLNNVCMMKYTNQGKLEWLTTLRGSNDTNNFTFFSINNLNYNANTGVVNSAPSVPFLFTTLDLQDNLVLYGTYFRRGFNFVNRLNTIIGSTPTSPNNIGDTVQTFVAKLNTVNGTEGQIATQGYALNTYGASGAGTIQPQLLKIDNSNHIVIIGNHNSTTVSYFVNSNNTNGYIRPQGYVSTGFGGFTTNGLAITRYDPFLSTVSSMVFLNAYRGSNAAQFLEIDSQNNYIVTGRFQSTIRQFNWFTSTNTVSSMISAISTGRNGVFIAKATNTTSNSWLIHIGNNPGFLTDTALNIATVPGLIPSLVGYSAVNKSTNRIYVTGYTSTGITYLYNKNNSTVMELGNSAIAGGSTCMYFVSYNKNGI